MRQARVLWGSGAAGDLLGERLGRGGVVRRGGRQQQLEDEACAVDAAAERLLRGERREGHLLLERVPMHMYMHVL